MDFYEKVVIIIKISIVALFILLIGVSCSFLYRSFSPNYTTAYIKINGEEDKIEYIMNKYDIKYSGKTKKFSNKEITISYVFSCVKKYKINILLDSIDENEEIELESYISMDN